MSSDVAPNAVDEVSPSGLGPNRSNSDAPTLTQEQGFLAPNSWEKDIFRQQELGFLPTPSHLRYNPEKPFKWTLTLNIVFGIASIFCKTVHSLLIRVLISCFQLPRTCTINLF